MSGRQNKIVFWTMALILVVITAGPLSAQVAVIAHKAVPEDSLTKGDVLDFYTGDIKKWGNNVLVVVLDLQAKSKAKEAFYDFLGKSPSRMKSIWLKKMLSGEGDPPIFVKSEKDMVDKVASTPGAIGFASTQYVSDGVKTLRVIKMQ